MTQNTSYETNSQRRERLKKENLWIIKWISRFGLLFGLLIFADFLLPSNESRQRIADSWHTRGGRQSFKSEIIQLESGQEFSIYPNQATEFREINTTGVIRVEISPIFRMVLRVLDENDSRSLNVSITSSYLIFLPILMLVASLIAVIANNRIDLVYNFGSVSLVLIAINLCLIVFVLK
jgi:hypothetical protein